MNTIKALSFSIILTSAFAACGQNNATASDSSAPKEMSAKKKDKKGKKKKGKMELKSELDSASYAIGKNIGINLSTQQGVTELNYDAIAAGLKDALENNEPKLSDEEAGQIMQSFFAKCQEQKNASVIKEGQDFLDSISKKDGVVTLPSGLRYEIIEEGNGPIPGPTSQVTTHYHGMLTNGEVFDSSIDRGQPATFPVNGVIKGWTEALQLMPTGSKWKLYIPYDLAYGTRGAGGKIGPYATLIFDIELISIQ